MRKIALFITAAVILVSACACARQGGGESGITDEPAQTGAEFDFSTSDADGNAVSLADYSGSKVIMINMWETWCGPCVNEMPDLQCLYAKYKDRGFLILGATASHKSEIAGIVRQTGIEYPVIMRNSQFDRFETGYVPTTVFIDGGGNILSAEPFVGGRSYSEWESIVLSYLNNA